MSVSRRSVLGWAGATLAAAAQVVPSMAQTRAAAPQQRTDGRNLVAALRRGGYVIVHRYTGTLRSGSPPAAAGTIDDGQRISETGTTNAKAIGDTYRRLQIPVADVLSSEYFFVYQTAVVAFGDRVKVNRDLTGSLHFRDSAELERSIASLRSRVAAPPPPGNNVVLWTHQGKFEKTFGYWLPAGETVVFQPREDKRPHQVVRLSLEQFTALSE